MSLQEYYEDSFRADNGRPLSEILIEVFQSAKGLANYVFESKNRFLHEKNWNEIKVLETGSGRGGVGLHLARLGAKVTLLDYSSCAIEQAKALYALEGVQANFVLGDVTRPDIQLNEKFDLIVDSHLLHCIISNPDRSSYFCLVKDHLDKDGIFIAETMVHRKKIFVPDGFMFDENFVLWQMFGDWKPVRRILDSLDLEQEIREADLHIAYFIYYANFGFVPHQKFMEIPSEILPASVRMVLKNN
jgi:2-polyprenyl-3-methyl-5-hydroxy-6-metoxy-1,4-benzoquinol methylase